MSDYSEIRKQILKQMKEDGNLPSQQPKIMPEPQFDSMYALENDEATVLYIVGMCVVSIFHGNWIFWIVFTIIWQRYIHRHNRKGKR